MITPNTEKVGNDLPRFPPGVYLETRPVLQASIAAVLLVSAMAFLPQRLSSQEPLPADSLVSIELTDGSIVRGRIVRQDEEVLEVLTLAGAEVRIPRAAIASIRPMRGSIEGGVFRRYDPNYSRLLFAPTGRPLRKGDGYFSDFYIFFPGVAYGLTDNLSVMAGMSVIPGLGLRNQLIYIAPRIGVRASEDVAVSAGVLYMSILEEDIAAGIVFGVVTYGREDKSFSAGVGFGYIKDQGEVEFAKQPIIMLGGNIRISNSIALISENWFITGAGFDLGQQPFSVALRFFGERLAVDLGLILIGEVLEEGFPIPMLSFTYNFGR